jgi:hypothetical protein
MKESESTVAAASPSTTGATQESTSKRRGFAARLLTQACAVPSIAISVLTISGAACTPAYLATDGSLGGVPPGGSFAVLGEDVAAALATSAARDIPCDPAAVSLVGANIPGDVYAVEGCGQRLTYSLSTYLEGDGRTQRFFLVARLPLSPGATRATSVQVVREPMATLP